MLINNKFFKNEIYIPHAAPSVTDSVTGVSESMTLFIDEYEKKCLVHCLGPEMYLALVEQIRVKEPKLVKPDADVAWVNLVNGEVYVDANGKKRIWQGIVNNSNPDNPKSFIAEYIYYFYEMMEDEDRTGVGNVKQQAENARTYSKTPKVVAAWNRFVEQTWDTPVKPELVRSIYGCGVDWYRKKYNGFMNLHSYIEHQKQLGVTLFDIYDPSPSFKINYFGI